MITWSNEAIAQATANVEKSLKIINQYFSQDPNTLTADQRELLATARVSLEVSKAVLGL